MATIRKLRGRWQAQVRRRGMKPRAKSFDSKADAEKWARDLETQVDRFGAASDTKILETTTLGALLERYQREITPTKRGAVQEAQRIDVLRRHDLSQRTLVGLSQQDVASFRDERLQSVAPSTAVRGMAILGHALEVAMRDWGMPLAKNVVKLVRRPVIRNERSDAWTVPRLICIAGDFTRYDEHAFKQIARNIELIRYRRFGDDLLMLELVHVPKMASVSTRQAPKTLPATPGVTVEETQGEEAGPYYTNRQAYRLAQSSS
ncbi:hypothetical protein [Shinella oryzae]|uniref:Uncharacterized protein n=1 Tax=Shinella oryzae TaxID=2871820 RepID=A0ABY9KE31_9HYPH|nr:hypothetical protein [Shinella oryzae]WLS05267.1 hypothetical protein Q9315_24260 [Shinella oryzae]